MKIYYFAAFILLATTSANACKCFSPAPLAEHMQPESKEHAIEQWKRELTLHPNVFSAIVVNIEPISSKPVSCCQAVSLSQVIVISGHTPIDSKVLNDFTTCYASLKVGVKYIFFAGVDMHIGQCSVQPFSESAVENIVRGISLIRVRDAVP